MRKQINLTKEHRGGASSTTFAGRPEGEAVRDKLNINQKDKDSELYEIIIPDDTTSFNPSFFLGLFFDSVVSLKGLDKFKEKYLISFSNFKDHEWRQIISEDIDDCYQRAENELNNKTGLD